MRKEDAINFLGTIDLFKDKIRAVARELEPAALHTTRGSFLRDFDYDEAMQAVEAHFEIPSNCGCCPDDSFFAVIPQEYLIEEDGVELAKQERKRREREAEAKKAAEKKELEETRRKAAEAAQVRAQKEERALFARLKEKYEGGGA